MFDVLYSFAPSIGQEEYDCRFVYCAFAISDMLNDWSAINLDAAVRFLLESRVSPLSEYVWRLLF